MQKRLITQHFEAESKLTVYGTDNLELVMQIPDAFTDGEFYYNLKMSNIAEEANSDTVMYRPQLRGEGELIQTSLLKAGEDKAVILTDTPEALNAGETLQRFYRITDQIYDQLKQYPNYKDFVFHFKSAMVKEITKLGVPLEIEVIPAAELAALYQQYRAVPAELSLTAPEGIAYGYDAQSAVITAQGTPAENAEYSLTYTWYDEAIANVIGEGETFTLPAGLTPGEYTYYCVVRSERKDNGHAADSD